MRLSGKLVFLTTWGLLVFGLTACSNGETLDPLTSTIPKSQTQASASRTQSQPADTSMLRNPPAPVPTIETTDVPRSNKPIESQQPVEFAPTPQTQVVAIGSATIRVEAKPAKTSEVPNEDDASKDSEVASTTQDGGLVDPEDAFAIDELNRAAMREIGQYRVMASVSPSDRTSLTSFSGRYVDPGALFIETEARMGETLDLAAGRQLGDVETVSRKWDGMEAVLEEDAVYVRYREHNKSEGEWRRASKLAETSGWYRLAYADWPTDRPDVYVDSSGILARVLPYIVGGFPPARPDNPETDYVVETSLISSERIGGRDFAIPREISPHYSANDLYLIEQYRPFESHPTGIEPGIEYIHRFISKGNFLTVAIMVNTLVYDSADAAVFVFMDFEDPSIAPVTAPEGWATFDRAEHEDLE